MDQALTHFGGSAGFRTEAVEGICALRSALAELIDELALDAGRPLGLSRRLGVDKSLASKISRLLSEPGEPLEMFPYLPGRSALELFLRAARQAGGSAQSEAAVRGAMSCLDEVARRHAGDRTSLGLMLNACVSDSDNSGAVALRRSAFRANSVMFGVQAKVQYKLAAVAPGKVEGMVDMARVRGFVAMLRLRPDVAWTLSRSRIVDDRGLGVSRSPRIRPLAIGDGRDGHLLLRAVSSTHLPNIASSALGDGTVEERILPGPVGIEGAFSLFSGDVVESVGSAVRNSESQFAASAARLHTPVEWLVFDYMVHESLFHRARPEFGMYSELGSPPWPACGEAKRLPLTTSVQELGKSTELTHSVDIPKFREIASAVFAATSWRPGEFLHYRVRLAYPPIPSTAVMRQELPSE